MAASLFLVLSICLCVCLSAVESRMAMGFLPARQPTYGFNQLMPQAPLPPAPLPPVPPRSLFPARLTYPRQFRQPVLPVRAPPRIPAVYPTPIMTYPGRPAVNPENDKGLSALFQTTIYTTRAQRRQQILGALLVFAAEKRQCKTLMKLLAGEQATYIPSQCGVQQTSCPTFSKPVQVGQVCMCCPLDVTPTIIASAAGTKGVMAYKDKLSNYYSTD